MTNSPSASPNPKEVERAKLAKLANSRKSLQKKLDGHSAFTQAVAWTLAAGGIYILATTLWSLKNTFFIDVLSSFIFGTATTPGLPVALAQAFVPAAFAPILAIAVPLLFLGYAISYQLNANRYLNHGKDKKRAVANTPDADGDIEPSNPAPAQQVANTQANQPAVVPVVPTVTPATPVATTSAAPVVAPVEPAVVQPASTTPAASNKAKKPQQGSLNPVVFNHQRQTRSQTKAAREAAAAPEAVEPQASATNKRKSTKGKH